MKTPVLRLRMLGKKNENDAFCLFKSTSPVGALWEHFGNDGFMLTGSLLRSRFLGCHATLPPLVDW